MWRAIYLFSMLSFRSGVNKSILMQSLAERQGRTAPHYAVRRGDLQLVEILLSMGADPSAKDNAVECHDIACHLSYGILEKRERKMRLRGMQKSRRVIGALGKREYSDTTSTRYVVNYVGKRVDVVWKAGTRDGRAPGIETRGVFGQLEGYSE